MGILFNQAFDGDNGFNQLLTNSPSTSWKRVHDIGIVLGVVSVNVSFLDDDILRTTTPTLTRNA